MELTLLLTSAPSTSATTEKGLEGITTTGLQTLILVNRYFDYYNFPCVQTIYVILS